MKRKAASIVLAVTLALVTAMPASAAPGTTTKSQTYPSGVWNHTTVTRDGCGAHAYAKPDRAQTYFYDETSNNSNIVCERVGARVYYYAGAQSNWTAWDYDWHSAQVLRSTYQTSQHSLRTVGAA